MKFLTRLLAVFFRSLWRALAVLLILSALVVQLGRMATPMVADYRPTLVAYVEQATGLSVSIESLAAEWDSLLPVLVVEGLKVSGKQGEPVLSVESALAEIDLLRTLLDQRLRFTDVDFLGLRSHFIQTEAGDYRLAGMREKNAAESVSEKASDYSVDDLRGLFLIGRSIRLVDLQSKLTLASGHELELVVNQVVLEHSRNRHRLSADIQLDQQPEAVRVVLEGSGDPFDIAEFGSQGYVKIDRLPSEKIMALLARRYWQGLPEGQWRKEGEVSVEAWISLTPERGLDWIGKVNLTGLPFELEGRQIPLRKMTADITGHALFSGDWQVQLQDIDLTWGEQAHPVFAIAFGAGSKGDRFFQADQLTLSLWSRWLNRLAALPPRLQALAEDLSPGGELRRVHVGWSQAGLEDLLIRANLHQVSAGAWHGAPAVTGVDGYVQSSLREGFVALDSRAGFSMHYTTVYDQPMAYDQARGHVSWWIQPEQQAVYVNSGPISLAGDDGQATGFLYIDVPTHGRRQPLELLLQIGIRNSAARFHKKYVPTVVSPKLREWLDGSVKGGDVLAGGFLFHGFLGAVDRPPSVQLWLDLDRAQLDYALGWPGLRDAQAELLLDSAYLQVTSSNARLLDSSVSNARITLDKVDGQDWLNIRGALSGPLADAGHLLSDSDLASLTGGVFADWALDGRYQGDLALAIPMGSADQRRLGYQVDLQLADASVGIPAIALQVEKVRGGFHVSDQRAVVVSDLTGSLWQEPVSVVSGLNPAGDTINLSLTARASGQSLLRWAGAPALAEISGSSAFDVRVDIPWQRPGEQSILSVSSDLVGMTLAFPAPLDKAAEAAIGLHVSLPLSADRLALDGAVGKYINTRLLWTRQPQGLVFDRGDVQYMGTARLPDQPMLSIGMQLQQFELAPWLALLDQQINTLTGASAEASAPYAVPLYLSIHTQALYPDEHHNLGETSFEAIRSADQWMFNLRNERVAGALSIPFAEAPLDLSLAYLRLPLWPAEAAETPVAESSEDAGDGAEATDSLWHQLARLPAMKVALGQVFYQEKNVGQLAFELDNRDQSLQVSHLNGTLFDLQFVPDEAGVRPAIRWQMEDGRSEVSGRVLGVDLGVAMESFGMAKLIESRSAQFDMQLAWAGTPADVSINQLDGELQFAINKGRFLRQDASAGNALMRLMGILNFDTWIRRLQLDFSDVYASGMAYDQVRGDLAFAAGQVTLREPVSVKTPSSKMQMAGSVDLVQNQIDTQLTVNLPVLDNLTFIAAVSAGLPVAAGVFVASRLFEKQFDQMTSVNYSVTGPLDEPSMKFMQISNPKEQAPKNSPSPVPAAGPVPTELPSVDQQAIDAPAARRSGSEVPL